jgi:hypothetical protein
MRRAERCGRVCVLLAVIGTAAGGSACAQPSSAPDGAGVAGVRHQINASVRVDLAFYGQRGGSAPERASMTAQVLISDNSQEFKFFGGVSAKFSDFSPADGSPEQKIWEDPGCHHERGFPKFTVIAIDGEMTIAERPVAINARVRQIGLLLPADEITPGRRLFGGSDGIGAFTVTRVETRQSHLFLDVKLYTSRCELK